MALTRIKIAGIIPAAMPGIRDTLLAEISRSGETRYRIAKIAGIDWNSLNGFLKGEKDIRLAAAERIAEHLGLELRPKDAQKRKKAG